MTRRISLPLADWPEADRGMWARLIICGDPFDDEGALSHLRETSKAALVKHYGRWLEWLFQSEPLALDERPELRATPERLRLWIRSLHHMVPPTLHTIVHGALIVLKAAAPDHDWRTQSRASNRLAFLARKSTSDRKAGRILSSAVLFDMALELNGAKAARANTPLNAALMRRDGMMIAFLSLMPIRLRSLSELTLGKSIQVSSSRIVVCLSSDMTKNGQEWEAQVPQSLELTFRSYIDKVRPWLMQRGDQHHQMLWVGRMGKPLAYSSIANKIPNVTKREIGIAVSPHLFRDAAATTVVRQSPKETQLIRALLGHKSYETAERHYIHALGVEAGRDHASAIKMLLEASKRPFT